MSSSKSDGDPARNEQFLSAVSKKRGTRPNISEEHRIREMEKCLHQGADINTLDKKGNTALHIAVQKDYKDVVKFLHRTGASTDIRNRKGLTAITLAEDRDKKEILDILKKSPGHENIGVRNQTHQSTGNIPVVDVRPPTLGEGNLLRSPVLPTRLEWHSDVAIDTDSTGSNLSRDPKIAGPTDRVIQPAPIAGQRTYNSSGLKQSFHGYAYQWILLMLILYRAREKGYPFRLDTELDAAGKFDDVILEYEDNNRRKVHRLIQIKHKTDNSKMITIDYLKGKRKGADDAFDILKYFISWREIKKRKDPIFEDSTSMEFIVCTNIGLDVVGLEVIKLPTDDLLKVTVSSERTPGLYKLKALPSDLHQKLISKASESEKISSEEISTFLTEFILAVNLPEANELEEMIKHEIRAYRQFNLKNMNFICSSFQQYMVNYLMKSKNDSKFLEKTDADEFFKEMEQALSSLMIVGMNSMYCSKLGRYDIKFERENGDLKRFLDSSSSNQSRILKFISSKQTLLTALRVYQTLQDSGKYQEKDSLIFIRLEELLSTDIKDEVLRAFESSHSHGLIVIDCGASSSGTPDAQNLWNRLGKIITMPNLNKKIILIIQGNDDPVGRFEVGCEIVHEKDSDISIDNLTKCSRQKLLKRRIMKFHGHDEPTSFGRLLNIHDCCNIELEKLSALRRIINQETLTQLIRGKEIPIGDKMRRLCEVNKYYIPRTIAGHVVIKRSVLQDPKIPDLFAITGIDLESLEKLLAPEEGTHKFDECNAKKLDPVKCHFLEKDRAKNHFKKLCEQNSNHNIHWLQAESGKLLWKRSHGNITDLMAFEDTVVYDENAERPRVSNFTEDQLMHHAEKCRIVIISDTAGMGKSTVLTHFAEKIKQNQSSSLVVKVDLTRHTFVLDEQKQKRTFDATDTDNAVDFLVDKLSYLDTEMEREVFKEIIKVIGGAALLFDGFDEISPEYENIVIDLLQALSSPCINELFITTRPHTSKELEKKLGIYSYHLQPFSRRNQTDFLIAFWKKGLNSGDYNETVGKDLKKHASEVLKFLVALIDRSMGYFTGIPLLTRMVAEIFPYEEEGRQIDSDIYQKDYPIIDLYRLFVEKKIEVFCKEKQLGDDTNPAHRTFSNLIGKIIMIIHQKLALEALFPDETVRANLLSCQPEIEKISPLFQEELGSVERIGIVDQVINKNPQFVHRTFAEYFAAQFLIDTLIDNRRNERVREFFVAEVFTEPQYKTVRLFLNCFLFDKDYVCDDEEESWKFNLSDHLSIYGETLYDVAADEKNYEIIKFFLHRLSKLDSLVQEANINLRGIRQTPLFAAIISRKSDIVKLLVKKGADINSVIENRRTPLHFAVEYKDLKIVKYIVKAGAGINPVDDRGLTPLHLAVINKQLNIVKYIVKKGADVNSVTKAGLTPLRYAIRTGDLDIVRYIVKEGADVNFVNNAGSTPLHCAIATGDLDIVRYIVGESADVNFVNKAGSTPLHCAIATGNLNIVRCIVEADADINSVNEHGLTPLHCAVATEDLNIVKCIVKAAADNHGTSDAEGSDMVEINHSLENRPMVISEAFKKSTPLHQAVEVKSLDTEDAVINSKGKYGLTPLHLAVIFGCSKIVQYLLKKSANVNSEADFGLTPRHIAVHLGHSSIMPFLNEHGANFDPDADCRLTLKQLELRDEILAKMKKHQDTINSQDVDMDSRFRLRIFHFLQDLESDASSSDCST